MITYAIKKIIGGESLTKKQAAIVMGGIMNGEATPAQIGGILVALRMKGETEDEITGFAQTMREMSERISPKAKPMIDTCGTGGDSSGTFNISTAAAFVVSAAGIAVAKHGNRSVSSKCGSADVLEALGVKIDLSPQAATRCIDGIGIGFMFAPRFHQAMKHAAVPRKQMGVRTVFNILGPLTNPAGAQYQLLGVYDEKLTQLMARVLNNLGTKRAMVVHGSDGIDEITISGKTKVSELKNGKVSTFEIAPEDFGIERADLAAVKGGDSERNAKIIRAVLAGEQGARSDIVAMNAGAA
ncbi:MAG: anthranilate phosphoribosyltransferase, partial [Clostridia bacterium]|nr:anthranilate phosphoribosyltransferase [Clostridia bacterium]